jgi:hypothetical protein
MQLLYIQLVHVTIVDSLLQVIIQMNVMFTTRVTRVLICIQAMDREECLREVISEVVVQLLNKVAQDGQELRFLQPIHCLEITIAVIQIHYYLLIIHQIIFRLDLVNTLLLHVLDHPRNQEPGLLHHCVVH